MGALTNEQMESSRKASVADGTFYSIMVGAGENFIVPFAIALGASSALSALIFAIPQFIAAVVQLAAVPISNFIEGRKKTVSIGSALQALCWLPIIALAYHAGMLAFVALILVYCAYVTLPALINPIWSAWMAELVPEHERGGYFSHRNSVTILATLLSAIAAGWLLNEYAAYHAGTGSALSGAFGWFSGAGALGGYVMIFSIALAARMVSVFFLTRMADCPPRHDFEERIGIITLLTHPAQGESRKFSAYIFFLMFAVYVSSPFIVVYMIAGLKFDPLTFAIISVSGSLARFLTLGYWGRLADRFGPRAVFITTGLMIIITPLDWLLMRDPMQIFIWELIAGTAWGGFELACFNFVLGRTEHRTSAVAVYNLSKGAGLFAGTVAGVVIFTFFAGGGTGGGPYMELFGLSVVLRLVVALLFLPRFGKDSFGGLSMEKFMWQALAVNPTAGFSARLSRSFAAGSHMLHSGVLAGEEAAKEGAGALAYAMRKGAAASSKIRLRKGL